MISTMYPQQQMAPMPQQQKPTIQKVEFSVLHSIQIVLLFFSLVT